MLFALIGIYFILAIPYSCESACLWPAVFISSIWEDGFKDELVFSTSTMTGWDVAVENLVVDDWECFKKDAFDSDGILEMKSTEHFELLSREFYGYICMKMTKITEASYRYYIYAPKQPNIISNERMNVQLTDSTVVTSCMESVGATGSEYHVMIKSGENARINCPYVFLGRYGYSVTTDSGSCDASTGNWSTCSDASLMSFDTSTCPANVAYSDASSVICVDSVPVGTNHLVTVYNTGTFDNINTFRFSCFAISYDGTKASVTPQTCKENQTPDQIPIASTGSRNGATITMVENGDKCPTCPELSEITGGSLPLYLTDGAITYATYSCDSQYDLYGAQRRACLADNTWDLEEPSCKCKAPAAPDNGNVTVSDDGNTATYTCNAGYIIKGLDTRTCQSTNAWNGTEPTCVSCDVINPSKNGSYVFLQDGTVNKVEFTCDAGTTMKGSNTSTCLSDGTWDQEPPTCVICASISFSTSGSITMATDGMVTTAMFSCMTGYTLVGDASLACNENGNWEGLAPACECNTPNNPANGDVSGDGSMASYTCHAGYNMVGESSRYCQDGGLGWNGTAPTCEQCAILPQPTGGNATISTDGQTSSVQVTCEPGYTLKGQSSATCGQDLQWNETQPQCVSCVDRGMISSGNVTITTDGLVTTATFACADGYTLTGEATQTCDTAGSWSSTLPTCKCILPGALSNGEIKTNADESILYYYCELGFSLSTTTFTRNCMEDGTGWSREEPVCRQCPDVFIPEGGNATLGTDKTVTSVVYQCDVGYSLNGAKTIKCTTEGTWETTEPTCSKCDDISSSPGRRYTTQSDGTETTTTLTCDIGYTLSGTSVISCDQNGDWKAPLPTCSKCSDKTAPSSGNVNVTTDGQTTTAYYTCKDGYYLDDLNELECRPDGEWNGPDPVCKCISPVSPNNGTVTILDNGETAKYTCDTNYTLNGPAERFCDADGAGWSDSQPDCVTCETIPDISGGQLNLTTTGIITQAFYTCPEGSTINGDTILSCDSDGTWGVDSFPTCETCPKLSSPPSGSVAMETDGSQTIATFICLTGYNIDGENTLTCLKNGTWDFVEPVCVCEPPAVPDFGSTSISEDKLTVSYTCEIGYTLSGDASRSCIHGGSGWNGTDPSCVTCQELTAPSVGNFNLTSTGTETKAQYSCDLGSTLKGIPQSSCLSNGTWDLNVPTCESCGSLAEPANGNVTMTTDGVTTIATYTCLPGYEVIGSSVTSCQTSGLWEQPDIECYCIPPNLPTNGSFTLSEDRTTVTFTCEEGFTLNGVDSRTCQIDGSGWTDASPTCTSCNSLPDLEGGNITWSTNGTFTVATISCDQGYTIKGVTEITCQSDGSWDFIIPECVSCPVIDPPTSGHVLISTDGSVSTALFTCVSGYDLVGMSSLTCGVDGQWNNNYPSCVCSPPINITNGNIFVNSTTVTYSCDVGYSIDGNVVRTCQENGSGWSGSDPSCVGCDTLSIPDTGSANLSSDGFSTAARFGCNVGASLDGEITLTCQSDGGWDSPIPVCVTCPNTTKPQNSEQTLHSNGSVTTASVTCAEEYDVVGDAESYCKTDGTWSSTEPICICKESDVPPPINGNRTISANGQVTTYTCDTGFTLKGNVERVCKNDSTGWSGTTPTCVSCPALTDPDHGSVNITTDGSSSVAEYLCDVRASLKGGRSLICLETAEWSSSPSSCVQCPEVLPLTSGSGNVTIETNGTISKAIYTCTEKYEIVGSSVRTCLQDGLWDRNEPRCTCVPPPKPENGDFVISSEGLVDNVIYTCNTNFTLNGMPIRKCGANGEYWDGSDPTCAECQPLSTVADGKLSFTTTGVETIVSIACDVGTSVSGINKLKCNAGGYWNASLPMCNTCKTLPAAANGIFNLTTDGATTSASLSCNEGYQVTGTGSVSCQSDGSWSIVGEQTCSPVETEAEENPLVAALIAVSVISVVIITVLSLLLARFVYLYLKRRKFRGGFGDGSYTKYETHDETDTPNSRHQHNGRIHHADMYDHPPPNDLIGIPLVPFEKTQAPMSHQQHVMERGNTSISPAPWGHQKPLMESKQSPRSIAPSMTEEATRTPSQASISQISIASLPPLPSVIRPPSSKTAKIKTEDGRLNSVKLIHSSSKHLVGKPGKAEKPKQQDESEPRPMTPVNF